MKLDLRMKVDLKTWKVIWPKESDLKIRQRQERRESDALRRELDQRMPARLAVESDVPPGSVLSEKTLELIRNGGLSLKGWSPRFLVEEDSKCLARAQNKRNRRLARRRSMVEITEVSQTDRGRV